MATNETTPYQATPETSNPEGAEKRDSVSPYKELLDKAAHEARHPPKEEPEQNTVHPLVEKGKGKRHDHTLIVLRSKEERRAALG